MIPNSLINPIALGRMLDTAKICPDGCFVEVGVYKGGSAWHLNEIAKEQGRELYLYDTFTGIPCKDDVDSCKVGDFSDTSAYEVQNAIPEAKVVKGNFPLSAVDMGPIAFVHLDVDQYKSYKEAIRYLYPKLVDGGIMWFDDANCLEGAKKAVKEFFGSRIRIDQICSKYYVIKGENHGVD